MDEGESVVGTRIRGVKCLQGTWDIDEVLLREDRKCAYPIVQGIPILIARECMSVNQMSLVDDQRYIESYEEMSYYNECALKCSYDITSSAAYRAILPIITASNDERKSFPASREIYLDAIYDCSAQWDAYTHISPVNGKRVLQIGGMGIHAVKFLLAGAKESWLVTPMIGEVICAQALAREAGVVSSLTCVVGIAEELPFSSDMFDAVYSGGCLHHTVTSLAFPECIRVLRAGGKLSAVDPWKTPVYSIGIKIFGKREDACCQPMTSSRIEPLRLVTTNVRIVHHGAITRYALLLLDKLGIRCGLRTAWWINLFDDAVSSIIPGVRKYGGSIAVLATKQN
jgi:uncharacterized protein YbaR (Trm112 family)/SAM-dependent methyltransferase